MVFSVNPEGDGIRITRNTGPNADLSINCDTVVLTLIGGSGCEYEVKFEVPPDAVSVDDFQGAVRHALLDLAEYADRVGAE